MYYNQKQQSITHTHTHAHTHAGIVNNGRFMLLAEILDLLFVLCKLDIYSLRVLMSRQKCRSCKTHSSSEPSFTSAPDFTNCVCVCGVCVRHF